jgi:hypothetical protein
VSKLSEILDDAKVQIPKNKKIAFLAEIQKKLAERMETLNKQYSKADIEDFFNDPGYAKTIAALDRLPVDKRREMILNLKESLGKDYKTFISKLSLINVVFNLFNTSSVLSVEQSLEINKTILCLVVCEKTDKTLWSKYLPQLYDGMITFIFFIILFKNQILIYAPFCHQISELVYKSLVHILPFRIRQVENTNVYYSDNDYVVSLTFFLIPQLH